MQVPPIDPSDLVVGIDYMKIYSIVTLHTQLTSSGGIKVTETDGVLVVLIADWFFMTVEGSGFS